MLVRFILWVGDSVGTVVRRGEAVVYPVVRGAGESVGAAFFWAFLWAKLYARAAYWVGWSLAMVISWSLNTSVFWALVHAFCSWIYIGYYLVRFATW